MRWIVYLLLISAPGLALAQQAGWGNVGAAPEPEVTWAKWWTEPMFSGFWMAWTRATLAIFVFIFSFIALLIALEFRYPGGAARDGVLGLTTTRGDRLFIGLLGSAYIFFAWLGLFSGSLLVPLGAAIVWIGFCFWRV